MSGYKISVEEIYDLINNIVEQRYGKCAERNTKLLNSDKVIRRTFNRIGTVDENYEVESVIAHISNTINNSPDIVREKLYTFAKGIGKGNLRGICDDVPNCGICDVNQHCRYFSEGLRIKQLPILERPREKLLYRGEKFLSDAELIAITLRTGDRKKTALHLAQELIKRFGDLQGLANRSAQELSAIKGVGKAKAAQIKAAFELAKRLIEKPLIQGAKVSSAEDVYLNYKERFRYAKREFFIAILLDSGNKIIKDIEVSIGSLTESIVIPREAFTDAVKESAANIIFIHNHPSGSSRPSKEDMEVTKKLKETAEIVGIRMLDHIVISGDGYTSFADEGLL